MLLYTCVILLVVGVSCDAALTDSLCAADDKDYGVLQKNLFNWITENGGYVNGDKLEISTGPDVEWTVRGIFATQPLGNGEMLLSLPPSLRICAPMEDTHIDSNAKVCRLIDTVAAEMRKGRNSFYWPYLDVIKSDEVDIPQTWSTERLKWLHGVYTTSDWMMNEVFMDEACEFDMSDAITTQAGLLVFSRATRVQFNGLDGMCMCPVYDLLNHDNAALNTAGAVSQTGQVLSIGTTTAVDSGRQLFNSFGPNNVAHIFRDYGFLPNYPRTWEFLHLSPGNADVVESTGIVGGSEYEDGETDVVDESSRPKYDLYVFEELSSEEIDLNPRKNHYQQDESVLAGVLKEHLTGIQHHTSAVLSPTVSAGMSDEQGILRAKWWRTQFSLALARALREAEGS